jgi:hypothetical protein
MTSYLSFRACSSRSIVYWRIFNRGSILVATSGLCHFLACDDEVVRSADKHLDRNHETTYIIFPDRRRTLRLLGKLMGHLFTKVGRDGSQDAGHSVENLSKLTKPSLIATQVRYSAQTHMPQYSSYSLTTRARCLVAV